MSPKQGALVRTALLAGLFVYSAVDDSMPPLWWVALVVVLTWTAVDLVRWNEELDRDD